MEKQKITQMAALPLESALSGQIYNALQGEIVEKILKNAKIPENSSYHRSMLEGHSFKVEKDTLEKYYNLFTDVKNQLGFNEPIDFYISGDSSVNAYAIPSWDENEPNIINVNSSLIELMTEDELRFVVGHEMGHLINKNAKLMHLISFVFPNDIQPPITLQYKIRLWNQLSELVADRFGYLAMPNIDVCISAFFKMSSGLDFKKMNMKIDVFLQKNYERLEFFLNNKGMNVASHPINPIRVQSLNLYSNSEYFIQGGITTSDLQNSMDDLIQVLLKVSNGSIDAYVAQFIATAGLMLASSDEEVSDSELETIFNELSNFQMFPKSYLENVAKQNVMELFNEALGKILEENPDMREGLLRYIIGVALSDKEIKDSEVEMIFTIAQKCFGYSSVEASRIFASMIQVNYVPSVQALC